MKNRKINSVDKSLVINISITRILIVLLSFTSMGLTLKIVTLISLKLIFLLYNGDSARPIPRLNSRYATGIRHTWGYRSAKALEFGRKSKYSI